MLKTGRYCRSCDGTGLGLHDGENCVWCRGKGFLPPARGYDEREDEEEDAGEDYLH